MFVYTNHYLNQAIYYRKVRMKTKNENDKSITLNGSFK